VKRFSRATGRAGKRGPTLFTKRMQGLKVIEIQGSARRERKEQNRISSDPHSGKQKGEKQSFIEGEWKWGARRPRGGVIKKGK